MDGGVTMAPWEFNRAVAARVELELNCTVRFSTFAVMMLFQVMRGKAQSQAPCAKRMGLVGDSLGNARKL